MRRRPSVPPACQIDAQAASPGLEPRTCRLRTVAKGAPAAVKVAADCMGCEIGREGKANSKRETTIDRPPARPPALPELSGRAREIMRLVFPWIDGVRRIKGSQFRVEG